jgi:hypothetical protein
MGWWRDPATAAPYSRRGLTKLKQGLPAPESVMAVLLACQVYIEEQDWAIGNAPEVFKAMQVVRMRTLRKTTISGNVRRLLGMVINQAVGVYLLTEARKVIAQDAATRTAMPSANRLHKPDVPRPVEPPIPQYPRPMAGAR